MRNLTPLAIALTISAALTGLAACRRAPPAPEPSPSAAASAAPQPTASVKKTVEKRQVVAPDQKKYPWLNDKSRPMPAAATTLSAAIPAPPGYHRVEVEEGSFAAWLRNLPLAAPHTPVVNYRGEQVHPGDDEYVQAVVAIDIGKRNLQQTTDVVLRLQAEWLWSAGRRDLTYRSATKDMLPYASYSEGKRILAQGGHLFWVKKKSPNDINDRDAFRDYLDQVFIWANSTAIRMQSEKVEPKDVRAGDFFMQRQKGGYSVVVLDIAEKPTGQRVALLGQCLHPAMNVYVARPGRATPWFSLRPPDPILTAHTNELKWADLRRLEVLSSEQKGD